MREAAEKRNAVQKPFSPLALGAVIISVIMACSGLATESLAYYDVTVGTTSANGAWAGSVWTPSGSGSMVAAAEIETRLASGAVAITTGSSGSGAEAGNIGVNTGVTWSANTLTLTGAATIAINAAMNGSGTAGLALQYGQGAVAAGNTSIYNVHAPVNLASTGSLSTKLGSDGTVKNYTILTTLGAAGSTTATDLQGMAGNLAGNYVLGSNIDASATSGWNSGVGFASVGSFATLFTGNFDGLGHTVSNLFINRPSTSQVGLFGYVGGGTLRNVGLVDVDITGFSSTGSLAGGVMIAGTTVHSTYVTGRVSGKDVTGGLIGRVMSNVDITNSHSSAEVTGLMGTGPHASPARYVGGFVGYNEGNIDNSYATGAVSIIVTGSNPGMDTGGFAGYNSGTIDNSYATGPVQGDTDVGGFVGLNRYGVITTSYSSGAVSGNSNLGGFAGDNMDTPASITNSYWDIGTSGQAAGIGGASGGATATNLIGLATADAYTQANYANLDFTNTWWMSDGNTRPFLRSEYSTTITSAHQLQMMRMSLAASYTLANDIDASETATAGGLWASGGFMPVGNAVTRFTGSLDGQGYVISGLTIARADTDYVGLFGVTGGATLSNIGLADVAIAGGQFVGPLVGYFGLGGTIDNSFVTGTVSGTNSVGGLLGRNSTGIVSNSYATTTVSGGTNAGGFVGINNSGATIATSYSAGAVSGSGDIGGFAGINDGTVSNSFWDTQTTGLANGYAINGGTFNATGKTTAEMQMLSTFAGWDIDAASGTGKVWRIYDGYTAPLLRGFLTPLNVQPDYDGSGAALTNVAAYTISGVYDPGQVQGTAGSTLTLSSTAANAYTASVNGLYSTQRGYDLVLHRSIVTPGSASGDIVLSAPISWTSGTLAINTSGTITQTAAIGGTSSAIFDLQAGTWNQVNAMLPAFAVFDFRLSGGTFIRALSGDGTAGTPYQLADIYGIQGMGSSSMLGLHYALANDVDASGTGNWNGGAGFVPVGTAAIRFTGSFDGQDQAISGLIINRPGTNYVGLFGDATDTMLTNIGLTNAIVTGGAYVGALAGTVSAASFIADSSAEGGSVTGTTTGYVGGLIGNAGSATLSISNSHASNSVVSTGGINIGGLIGYNHGTVTNSYATGTVTASTADSVGGLVGAALGGLIENCYAAGAVNGNLSVGGLVGYATFGFNISNCYAAGPVSGGVLGVGGLIGRRQTGSVTACFWDTQTSGQATSAAGIGKTTVEMQSLVTFTGWDIDGAAGTGKVWRIYDGHTYPLLRSFLTPLTVTADNVNKGYDGVPYSSPLSNPSYSIPGAAGSGHLFNLTDPYQGAVEIGSYSPVLWSDQPGYDISYIDALLTITKADQTITFAPLPDRTYGDADFAISATASSGLAVSFASTTPGVCTVSGTLVSLVAPGTCSITASQAGDVHYNAAVDVSRSFMVNATVTPLAGANGSISPPDPQVVAYNTTVSFTIVPAIGYHVAAVGGTCGGSYTGDPADSVNGILYTTSAVIVDCTVQASFAINQYTVSAIAGVNGSLDPVTPSPQTVDHGTTTQFTFHADTDYYIASITGCGITYLNGDQSITTRSETTPPITGDCTVTATFAITTHQLAVIVQGKGRVTADSGGIDCPGTCAGTYDHTTVVTLTPTPEQSGKFAGWSGDADCEDGVVTMTADLTCTAEFSQFRWWIFWPAVMQAIQQSQQGATP